MKIQPTTTASIFGEAPGLGATPQLPKSKGDGQNDPEATRSLDSSSRSFCIRSSQSMRATVPKEGLMGAGSGGEVFTDMLDQQYAELRSPQPEYGLGGRHCESVGGR